MTTPTVLLWRWRAATDPNQPSRAQTKREGLSHAPCIAHPLADRFGQRCGLLAQSRTNGNRLVEFEDGYRVVSPLYATRAAK